MNISRVSGLWVSILISVLVLIFLALIIDLRSLNPVGYSVNWPLFGISSALFLANYIFRSARFREFLKGEIRYKSLFGISLVHGALNYFFPLKTGELSFPLLSRLFLGRTLLESGVALIVCRILDLVLVLAMFSLVLLFLRDDFFVIEAFNFNRLWLFLLVLAFSVILFFVPFLFCKKVRLFQKIPENFYRLKEIRLPEIIRLSIMTLVIWFCILGNFYFLALCLGYQVPFAAIIVVSTIMTPLSMIPLQGFANIGIFELAWVSGLMLFGMSRADSLELAIKVHVLLTIQVIALLFLGAFLLVVRRLDGKHA